MKNLFKKIAAVFAVSALAMSMPVSVSASAKGFVQPTESIYEKGNLDLTDEQVEEIIENTIKMGQEENLSEAEIEELVSMWYKKPATYGARTTSTSTDYRDVTEVLVCANVTSGTATISSNDEIHFQYNKDYLEAVPYTYANIKRYSYVGSALNSNFRNITCTDPEEVSNSNDLLIKTKFANTFSAKNISAGNNIVTFNVNLIKTESVSNIYKAIETAAIVTHKPSSGNTVDNVDEYIIGVGDLDRNGILNDEDRRILACYINGVIPDEDDRTKDYANCKFEAYDVTRNSIIDIRDMTRLNRYILRLEETFWVVPE